MSQVIDSERLVLLRWCRFLLEPTSEKPPPNIRSKLCQEEGYLRSIEIRFTVRNTARMSGANPIRVLLAEDHPMVRQSLRIVLEAFPNVQVVGESITGEEAVIQAGSLQPHIVLMDVNMPLLDGIAATRLIKTKYPQIAVIGLTCHSRGDLVSAMTRAGAFEVVPKEKALDLYEVIERAVIGFPLPHGGSIRVDDPPIGTSFLP